MSSDLVFSRKRGSQGVAHYARSVLPGEQHTRTVCGRVDEEGFLGTGGPRERERAAAMRLCKYCHQLDSRA
jgi:hypothetical protein